MTASPGQLFVERLENQHRFPRLYVKCVACTPATSVTCPLCIGTGRVSRAERRRLLAEPGRKVA